MIAQIGRLGKYVPQTMMLPCESNIISYISSTSLDPPVADQLVLAALDIPTNSMLRFALELTLNHQLFWNSD